jgi:DNA/RNA-binding domain of Phe-tRNA-synthetase-like protein
VLAVAPNPRLLLRAFTATFPAPLGELSTPAAVAALLAPGAVPAEAEGEQVRAAVRDVLRHGGFKPTGRSKPASEYLRRAVAEGALASINAAVDTGNAISLQTGIPVSVVDLDLLAPPLAVEVAPPGISFVFNATGQAIDVSGLVGLRDAEGFCANAVKDAMRTKTHPETRRTLSLLWGAAALGDRTDRARERYLELLAPLGASIQIVA